MDLTLRSLPASRTPRSAIPYLVLSCPLTDPTTPYHSIPYRIGATAQAGFSAFKAVDVNVEALNYLAKAEQVERLLESTEQRRREIESRAHLSREEQLIYPVLSGGVGLAHDAVERALDIFRTAEDFYTYQRYRQAVMTIKRWLALLHAQGPPMLYNGFELNRNGPVNLNNIEDLTSPAFLDQIDAVIRPYLDGPFTNLLAEGNWRVVGVSINYLSQLPFALSLLRRVRAACQSATVVVGGTEVSDDVKYLQSGVDIWRLYSDADLIVAGEGESALTAILEAARASRVHEAPLPGVMSRNAPTSAPQIVYEDVSRLPSPRYDVWDWSRYWSPEPVVLYSPTRGCYWNKCTFCDYGLNADRPTSPSRERDPQRVVEDLVSLSGLARTIYFAVDAMSPIYLRKLCEAVVASGLKLRWSAELRLERSFPASGMSERLRQAGCVAVSFGYESATQRILDLINKGVRISDVLQVLMTLKNAVIGAEMMGFTGFPSETTDEAAETYKFLLEHEDLWTIAGIGEFVLTRGSIVARQPERFGVALHEHPKCDDVERWVPWSAKDPSTEMPLLSQIDAEMATTRLAQKVMRFVDDRPFVGGIDSGHSLLYFARNSPQLLPEDWRQSDPWAADGDLPLLRTPFADLPTFTQRRELEDFHKQAWLAGEADASVLGTWLGDTRALEVSSAGTLVEITPSGCVVPVAGAAGSQGEAYSQLRLLILQSRGFA